MGELCHSLLCLFGFSVCGAASSLVPNLANCHKSRKQRCEFEHCYFTLNFLWKAVVRRENQTLSAT